MKQPLAIIALLYVAGVLLGRWIEAPLALAFIAAAAFGVVALRSNRLRPLALPALLFLFGWINMSARTAVLSPHDLRVILHRDAELVTIRGCIASTPMERVFLRNGVPVSQTVAEIEVTAIRQTDAWRPAFGQVMSRTSGVLPATFVEGQLVEIAGVALKPEPPNAPGLFDYAEYLNSRGIYFELKATLEDWQVVGPVLGPSLADRFRSWAQRTLARGLPTEDDSLRLQWAMLLGWQTALTSEVAEPFLRSGTMHIFAISGLHIALIAGILVMLLRAAMLPRFVCGIIVIPALWFYTAATGWQPSAIRSTIMMSVILAGWLLRRPSELLNSLAAAACIILVWEPEQLFQAGFQLSFFVVLSLALLSPVMEKLRERIFALDPMLPCELRPRWQRAAIKAGEGAWKGFATSLAAFLGSMPLIACYFHLLTPGSLVANLAVVPASALALMSGLGSLVTAPVLPALSEILNHSGWFFMSVMVWLSETIADAPGAWWHVKGPPAAFFVLYYGLLIALSIGLLAHRRWRWCVAGAAAALLGLLGWQWHEQRSWHRLTVLPLGDAHAIFAKPGGREGWLINSGDRGAVEFTLKPFLAAQGVNSVRHFVFGQGESAFVGGATDLNEQFPIRSAYATPLNLRSARYREAIAALETNCVARSLTNGARLGPWKVLHPDAADRAGTAMDASVVLLGEFDGVHVLHAPKLSPAGQKKVFQRHPELRTDILVFGATPEVTLSATWIEALAPRLIVVAMARSTGADHVAALVRHLRKTGAEVLVTADCGAVTLSLRKGKWRVETARPSAAPEFSSAEF